MNLNLHDVVRGAVTSINEDVPGTIYVSTGRVNTQGIVTPTYASVSALLQVQAQKHSTRENVIDRGTSQQKNHYMVYAYGDFAGIVRPDGKGGDLCNFNGQWWAITQVSEWWPLWSSFEITRQVNATTLAALQAQIANGATAS